MGQNINKTSCSNCKHNYVENNGGKYLYKFVDNTNKSFYFCGKCIYYRINNNNYFFSEG